MRNARILLSSKEEAHSPSRETLTYALSCIHLHFERIRPRCHGNTKRFKGDRWISSKRSKWRMKEMNEKRKRNIHAGRDKVRCSQSKSLLKERRVVTYVFLRGFPHIALPHPLTLHPFISFCAPPSPSILPPRYSPATLSRGTLETRGARWRKVDARGVGADSKHS